MELVLGVSGILSLWVGGCYLLMADVDKKDNRSIACWCFFVLFSSGFVAHFIYSFTAKFN